MKRLIVLLFVAASFGSSPLPASEPASLVAAPAGTLRGAAVGDIRVFKGIPYALPPTGAMRWKPPVPAPSWKNTREATEFGFACVQPKPQPGSIYSWDLRPMSRWPGFRHGQSGIDTSRNGRQTSCLLPL